MASIGIVELIRWAWTEELVKVEPEGGSFAGYSPNSWMAQTGTSWSSVRINRFGAAYDAFTRTEPHPDALVIARAVDALDDLTVRELDDADFFGSWCDLGDLGEAALARAWDLVSGDLRRGDAGVRVLHGLASSTVVAAALTGKWPEWRGDHPKVISDTWPNGSPKWLRLIDRAVEWDGEGAPVRFEKVEVDGFSRIAQRPYPGAYRVYRLSPDPAPILAARIRWAMLHAWLCHLAVEINGIGGRTVLAPAELASPWLEYDESRMERKA